MNIVLSLGRDAATKDSTYGSCESDSHGFSLCSLDVRSRMPPNELDLHASCIPAASQVYRPMSADLQSRPKVPAGSAGARAYRYVKERLLDGRYPGGMLLSENQLARELGISRTPVSQAFVQLEAEELLDLYPRRGAVVRPVSISEADDVLEARLLIETHCVRRIAAHGPALAAVLLAAVARQERALQDGGAGFTVADREFHRAIVAANRNPILVRQYDELRDRHQRITATLVARDPARGAQFIAEHREIAEALERRQAEHAVRLVDAHLRGAYELMQRPRP
jgi:DNA-binding GntR family transcriptional regulator